MSKREMRGEGAILAVSLTVGILAAFIFSGLSQREILSQHHIQEKVLRFHIMADSNSIKDQEEKIRVRNKVAEVLAPYLENISSKEEAMDVIKERENSIYAAAEEIVGEGNVKISLGREYFPIKKYGKVVLPEGEYETLNIEVGSGRGHNWWCVLYPSLCFTKIAQPAYNEEGERKLKMILDDDARELIFHPIKTKISFWWMNIRLNSHEEQSRMVKSME